MTIIFMKMLESTKSLHIHAFMWTSTYLGVMAFLPLKTSKAVKNLVLAVTIGESGVIYIMTFFEDITQQMLQGKEVAGIPRRERIP